MGWIRSVDRQALHRPHGSLAVHLKYKKKTYLTQVFGLRHSIYSDFAGSARGGGSTFWRGDFALLAFFLFGPEIVSSIVVFLFTVVSTCREGKLGVFFLFGRPSHLGSVLGAGRGFFGPCLFRLFPLGWGSLIFCHVPLT